MTEDEAFVVAVGDGPFPNHPAKHGGISMTEKPTLELIDNAASSDPFDLTKLRVNRENIEGAAVKKLLTTVPVKKPSPHDFIRVRPEPAFRETFAFVEFKDNREFYLVDLGAVPEMYSECFIATLFTVITRTDVLFMWPVRIPAADGRVNNWHQSAASAVQHAMTRWVRVKANMSLGANEIFEAESSIPDPVWPDMGFDEIYRIAFRDRLINHPDHPVIKRLRGG
ncbi:hypothetical protein G5V57_07430 [Nordella sp. HKS 07]|uniref:hypothetical protein n=1 Tax=Nordella sp. HKS 07 TaxID=2712222 RepID=UPI0013E1131D|nr:hypothetical protein [Nordella sp. HKS 07]QIG47573.1 hypothetical protein G5V57_07430 [Nordella sp. HKS 07]